MIVIRPYEQPVLSLAPATEAEARAQELYILLNTILGECPMYRDFGISRDYIHMPVNAARTALTLAITEAIRKYFPDMRLVNVRFEKSNVGEGFITPVLEVSENG